MRNESRSEMPSRHSCSSAGLYPNMLWSGRFALD